MEDLILRIVDQFGYWGIFLLIMVENVFPPIPSEVILTFGGFITTYSGLHIWGVIAASTAGSVAGAMILYLIGRLMSAARLSRLFDSRLGRALHLHKGDVTRAGKWFRTRGNHAVFFCRFVPIVRSLISIPAGVAKMDVRIFLALTVAGTLIWNSVLILLGRMAGSAWDTIGNYLSIYSMVALAVLAVAAAVVGAIFIKKRFFNHSGDEE